MLLRKAQRLIRKLPDPINPGNRIQLSDTAPGPESPLERNPQSPTGWRKRESDGVGLGIVAALQRSDGGRSGTKDIVVKITTKTACHGRFFCGSPPAEKRDDRVFRMADFLSCCYLCRKNLQGKDIYMYRGEKAFCSAECRYQQIVNEEFQEKYGSEACRPSDISGTSYTDDRLFFTGIAAA